jgi:predicted lipid-binding transport protein (Tim44 family)
MKQRKISRLHLPHSAASSAVEKQTLLIVVGLAVLLVLALVFLPMVADRINAALRLFEAGAALMVLAAGGLAFWLLRQRQVLAEKALAEAAAADDFWNRERLQATVENLFVPYWRAVAGRDAAAVAGALTPYWQEKLAATFADWTARDCRPSLLDIAFRDMSVVGLEDWRNNERDQVSLRVLGLSSYHVTDMSSGRVIEGIPAVREEEQLWQMVRGESGWLLNRVEFINGPADYGNCRVVREIA